MKKVVKLATIIDEEKREEAKHLRENLFLRCRQAIDQMEDDIAGFALVVWDHQGNMRSSYNARGPISYPIVPTLVSDALNRHISVEITKEQLAKAE